MEKVQVSELIAQALEDLGIEHVSGIIGASNVHLYEAISRHGSTEIICDHHEQAACMALQTHYRISSDLTNTHNVMNNTFWIGVQPALTREMLEFAARKIETYLGVNF